MRLAYDLRVRFFTTLVKKWLKGEDVPHHAIFVYDVRDPTGKETEGLGHPVLPPDVTALVAETLPQSTAAKAPEHVAGGFLPSV